jgi:hypothetical protein
LALTSATSPSYDVCVEGPDNHRHEDEEDTRRVDLEAVRRELAALVCRKDRRTAEWSEERPTEFRPGSVINPETGDSFSEAGAWYYIFELLESGHPLELTELEKPKGKPGYVLRAKLGRDLREVYIKLELGDGGRVIGRSFHYSEGSNNPVKRKIVLDED